MKNHSPQQTKLLRINHASFLGHTALGRPRWFLSVVDETGQSMWVRTQPGALSACSCKPCGCIGQVLRVTFHVTPRRVMATAWEAGNFEMEFAALERQSKLNLDAPIREN